jgi:hypothetical protein
LKQDGKISQAIETMNAEILQHFSADDSSWEELAELCVRLLSALLLQIQLTLLRAAT